MRYVTGIFLLASFIAAQGSPQGRQDHLKPHRLKRIASRGEAVHDACYTADGRHFATISALGEVRIRTTSSGECIQSVDGYRSSSRQQLQQLVVDEELDAFGLGGKKIYRISDAQPVSRGSVADYLRLRKGIMAQYRDLPEARFIREAAVQREHKDLIRIVSSPTGESAVVFLSGDRAMLWNKKMASPILDHARMAVGMAFSANGQHLAFRIHKALHSHSLTKPSAHELRLRDNPVLITSGARGSQFILADKTSIRIYDGESGKITEETSLASIAQAGSLKIRSFVSCSSNGTKLIGRTSVGLAMIDLVASKAWGLPDTLRAGAVTDWLWLSDEKAIRIKGIYPEGPGQFREWSIDTFAGPRLQHLSSFEASCGDHACLLPSSSQVISGGFSDGHQELNIYDLESHKLLSTLEGEGGLLVRPLTENCVLALGLTQWTIHQMPSGKVIAQSVHKSWINCAAVSPDGRRFAIGSGQGNIDVFELR